MKEKILPKYPIYIPSKGRFKNCLTANFLIRDKVPFYLVIEPQEYDSYAKYFSKDYLLVLPFSNRGSVIPTRNWIKEHATKNGHVRHWQMDDNMRNIRRRWKTRRIVCDSGIALKATEDFVDRYENVAVAGLNYMMFVPNTASFPPFFLNNHVYSCTLTLNSLPYKWRGRYNEDTDYCLQVLANGWCTILMNIFNVEKMRTMTMGGGNTAKLYQSDGRVKMARALERLWPGVVQTKRRFQRAQHVIKGQWRGFDTPLIRRKDIDFNKLAPINEYGMELKQVKPIKNKELKKVVEKHIKDKDLN
jgi:hypothetical protein